MINKLSIKNFKSVKELDIDCRRINLFIGEPNTGKSNILEVLGLLSWIGHNPHKTHINNYLRIEAIGDLFFDNLLDEKIMIAFADKEVQCLTEMTFKNDRFLVGSKLEDKEVCHLDLDHSGDIKGGNPFLSDEFSLIKYYSFLKQSNFPDNFFDYLLPPNGTNLYALVMANNEIRELMNILFEGIDMNFMMKADTKTIEPVKQIGNISIDFPLSTASDTLNQIIFFYAAMESNKNSTLIFDNPLSTASPAYAKHFGERIAFDDSNQYFISTHNLYLLTAILEKTSRDSVNLFITYLKNYDTRVRKLKNEEISVLLDSDPFFNANYFLEEE